MFEIVVNLCLLVAPDVCRMQLVAGLETPAEEACMVAKENLDAGAYLKTGVTLSAEDPLCREMPGGLELTRIADGVFVHMGAIAEPDADNLGDIANLGVVIGETSIAVIDAGGSRAVGEDLFRAIRQRSQLPISHLVLTHVHPDHVFGADVFAEAGALVVGHPNFRRALQDRQDAYLRTFRAEIGQEGFLGTDAGFAVQPPQQIDLGGRTLELQSWPLAHSSSDLTVLDNLTGILFAGDLVFDRHLPVLDGSLKGWLSVLEGMEALGAERLVPGHGGPVIRFDDGTGAVRAYLQALESDTRQSLDAGERMSHAVTWIARDQRPYWELFDIYNTRNATVSFTELEWE